MKFQIEQIALVVNHLYGRKAWDLLMLLGMTTWVKDEVVAKGVVHDQPAINTAELQFNYTALDQCRELEVLRYIKGPHWYDHRNHTGAMVSHIGMHCTEEELRQWVDRLTAFGLHIVQEVNTITHTNPAIKDARRYHYCIFGAAHLIGVDLKFIVRRDV